MTEAKRIDPAGIDALAQLRASSCGPWSPEALAEDVRAMADFERTGEGIPFDEVVVRYFQSKRHDDLVVLRIWHGRESRD